jgi:P27 family predicted phage terminase small subunit
MSGPKPIPTRLKVLRGNPGHQVLNLREPNPAKPPEVPSPPSFLMDYAAEEWRLVAVELYRLGLLTVVDGKVLAAYCQAYGRWRKAEEALARMAEHDPMTGAMMVRTHNGNHVQNPIVITAQKAAKDMVRFASEFGFSPAARSRIAAGADNQEPRKFAGLLAG